MNTDEIVRALRCCSNVDTRKPDCDNCPLFGTRLCVKTMLEGAADLIESLQAQLAKYDEVAAEYGIDGKTMLTLAKSQIRTAQDNIKLREQLAASSAFRDTVSAIFSGHGLKSNATYQDVYDVFALLGYEVVSDSAGDEDETA